MFICFDYVSDLEFGIVDNVCEMVEVGVIGLLNYMICFGILMD